MVPSIHETHETRKKKQDGAVAAQENRIATLEAAKDELEQREAALTNAVAEADAKVQDMKKVCYSILRRFVAISLVIHFFNRTVSQYHGSMQSINQYRLLCLNGDIIDCVLQYRDKK